MKEKMLIFFKYTSQLNCSSSFLLGHLYNLMTRTHKISVILSMSVVEYYRRLTFNWPMSFGSGSVAYLDTFVCAGLKLSVSGFPITIVSGLSRHVHKNVCLYVSPCGTGEPLAHVCVFLVNKNGRAREWEDWRWRCCTFQDLRRAGFQATLDNVCYDSPKF